MDKVKLTIIADEIDIKRDCIETDFDPGCWRQFKPSEYIIVSGKNLQMKHEIIKGKDARPNQSKS